MIKPVHLLAVASLAAALVYAAVPSGSPARAVRSSGPECFRASSVRGYSAGPPGFVNVQTDGNRWFRMHLSGGCPEFGWIMKIGIRPMDSSWLCEGKSDELIAPHPGQDERCYVSDIRLLAPGESS